jgi:hypothetical protein
MWVYISLLLFNLYFYPLLAETNKDNKETIIKESDKVLYEKNTKLDFSDLNINADALRPSGSYIKNRKKTSFNSLIELRSNFNAELKYSVDGL